MESRSSCRRNKPNDSHMHPIHFIHPTLHGLCWTNVFAYTLLPHWYTWFFTTVLRYRTQVTYFFDGIAKWQSVDLHVAKHSNPGSIHKHFMKSSSVDTSRRVCGLAEKDLWIKCCEFKRLASWESLRFFISAMTISDLGNDGLHCDYNWPNRFVGTEQIIHWSTDRARTFCG